MRMWDLAGACFVILWISCSTWASFGISSPTATIECSAWLVQSTPTGLSHLPRVPGVLSTGDVFQWLAGNATTKLDLLAQYWQLVAQPDNPLSGDYGYTNEEMLSFGAPVGKAVYDLLEAAAARGVDMRIIQHSGVFPDYDEESASLAASRTNVKNVTLLMDQWWGSGIVHTKVWIADGKDIYIGSANNDWKSLTQVKELGIYITNCPVVAKVVEGYFGNLWTLAHLEASHYTKEVWDHHFQVSRRVPCWSHFLTPQDRCKSPLHQSIVTTNVLGYPYIFGPALLDVKLHTSGWKTEVQHHGSQSYLSCAPPEVVFAKHVTVKLLVGYWRHSPVGTMEYLAALNHTNTLCAFSKYKKCGGKVEIKFFIVPGFEATGPRIANGSSTGNAYPSYTRVMHAKYAVSDVRAHIGTSNLIWDYFYTTSGLSFGTYNEAIVSQLQAIFDADWASVYAVPWQDVGALQDVAQV